MVNMAGLLRVLVFEEFLKQLYECMHTWVSYKPYRNVCRNVNVS